MTRCPPHSELERLLAGDALPELEAHLELCPACQEALEQLTATARPNPRHRPTGLHPGETFLSRVMRSAPMVRPETVPAPSPAGYQLLSEVGRGVTGVVYQARQIATGRLVALKMLHSRPGKSAAIRFRREVEALAWLRHPNLVQIYEVGEWRGRPYLVMEFVEGGSLDQRLRNGPLLPHHAAPLLAALAQGVQAAHAQGLVHRDLKPANILLKTHAPKSVGIEVPKVADFGLAKHFEDDGGPTGSGAILGTPSYMAPEQAEGKASAVGPAADVYSLGAILFETIIGHPPFPGTSIPAILEQVRSQPAPGLRQLRPDLPAELERICARCLEKEPGRRYPSARNLAEELQRFIDASSSACPAVSSVPIHLSTPPVTPRQISRLLLGGMAVLVVLAGTIWRLAPGKVVKVASVSLVRSNGIPPQRTRSASSSSAPFVPLVQETQEDQEKSKSEHPWRATERLAAEAPVRTLAVAGNGKMIFCGGDDGRLLWFDPSRRREAGLFPVTTLSAPIVSVAIHEQTVAAICRDGSIHFYDTGTGKRKGRVMPTAKLDSATGTIAFAPDGQMIAAGMRKRVNFLNPTTGRTTLSTTMAGGSVTCLAYSPDGQKVAVGLTDAGEGPSLYLLDARSGKVLQRLPGASVSCLSFSANGRLLAVGGPNRTVRLWDMESGNQSTSWQEEAAVTAVTFAPGGTDLAVGRADGIIRLRDASSGKARTSWPAHKGLVTCLAFPDRPVLVSGGSDPAVAFWSPSP